ncbi:GNAT family N-acetyltransferase [Bradyrhizobium prioriisuperbiae]|uniref:GNAT family N-acetyltransferase n=1 Tax=Bradyrhizobium prioriisuperbiae TaxID=2854389 RepID=UPI0028EEC239|nr:GNAT family N-acetyltransferase [Bradyrhizobium prioritasuperba]
MSLVMPHIVQAMPSRQPATAFLVDVSSDWQSPAWNTMIAQGRALPFQHTGWLEAWYAAFARTSHLEPLIVTIRDRETGELALALPLIVRNERGLRVAEFADLNLTDYNAPVLGPAAPRDPEAAEHLWRALCAALDGIDLIRFKKMPVAIGDRPNPLALIAGTHPCQVNGNLVTTGDDFDAYRFSLERTVRKELERSWRVFTRHPEAGFRAVTDTDEALRLLAVLETQQSTRMHDLGQTYLLNEDTSASFYRNLIVAGLHDGSTVMTALTCGDEIVATLLGVRSEQHYIMIRISNAGAQWSNCSPGRLIIAQTMAHLHAQGVRLFDFSIGNYAYKRRFDVAPVALVDKTAALGWRGLPNIAREGAIQWLRRHPALDERMRRAFGKVLHTREA